ncbi:MAG TPA: hypothetical protein VMN60_04595 [Longimicrobiales bacterium]|nr:hypothetical protein [Longimicrobiales bacterium]
MAEKRQLGAILLESGRITQDDVDRVLDYQRTHGGFFGQALVALSIVTREEIDWALASQFDLPFIFPNADAVDRDAANMVKPDWALAHLAVPIVRAGKTLTVVVADPLHREVIDELRARTGCEVEMALASSQRIRELIHAVYDAAQTQRIDDSEPIGMEELMTDALAHGAERFGVSIRSNSAVGWWRTRAEARRVPLRDGWDDILTEFIDPPPLERLGSAENGRASWDAMLRRVGDTVALEAQALVGAGGAELMFRPLMTSAPVAVSAEIVLPPTLITELRLLWRAGSARVGVSALQIDLARALLPVIPSLALGEHVRAAHINESGEAGSMYTLRAAADDAFPDMVAGYELDALTVDLPVHGFPVRALLRGAPLTLMLLDEPEERAAPGDWGLNWLLTIAGQPGNYSWDLRALHR